MSGKPSLVKAIPPSRFSSRESVMVLLVVSTVPDVVVRATFLSSIMFEQKQGLALLNMDAHPYFSSDAL
jgi:hypothetical protein